MRWLRLPLGIVAVAVAVISGYLLAGLIGAVVPDYPNNAFTGRPAEPIYLLMTPLHADYAIPVDRDVRKRFAFLRDLAGIPIDNPRLKFLVFGWGSKAFYTTAKSYADIRPGPTLRAITGDESVMHVVPAGDISGRPNAYRVDLPPGGTERLLDFVRASFAGGKASPRFLAGKGYGLGDAFFEADGKFDLFRPCNVWAAAGLRHAGLATGRWTPTTFSLMLGLRLHSGEAVADPML